MTGREVRLLATVLQLALVASVLIPNDKTILAQSLLSSTSSEYSGAESAETLSSDFEESLGFAASSSPSETILPSMSSIAASEPTSDDGGGGSNGDDEEGDPSPKSSDSPSVELEPCECACVTDYVEVPGAAPIALFPTKESCEKFIENVNEAYSSKARIKTLYDRVRKLEATPGGCINLCKILLDGVNCQIDTIVNEKVPGPGKADVCQSAAECDFKANDAQRLIAGLLHANAPNTWKPPAQKCQELLEKLPSCSGWKVSRELPDNFNYRNFKVGQYIQYKFGCTQTQGETKCKR